MTKTEKNLLKLAIMLMSSNVGDANKGWDVLCEMVDHPKMPVRPEFDRDFLAEQSRNRTSPNGD